MRSMLRRSFFVLMLLFCAAACAPGRLVAPPESPDTVSFAPAQPETWKLANGLTVMWMPDDELPLFSGTLYLKGGSLWEKGLKPGVTSVMGSQLREGGAGSWSPDELDRELEKLAASISSGYSEESGSIGFSCLAKDSQQVFAMFSDVLLRPRFDRGRFALWQAQSLEDIKRRADNSQNIVAIGLRQLLFGGTPYGRVLGSKEVKALSVADLLSAYSRFVHPEGAILALSGSLPREQVQAMVEQYLGGWEASAGQQLRTPPVLDKPAAEPAFYFVELPRKQATVLIGQRGVSRHSPDRMAIDVFNEAFGSGSFNSRLMQNVRDRLGLAYSAMGGMEANALQGRNLIMFETRLDKTGPAIKEALRTLREMQDRELSQAELAEIQAGIENSFVFKFDERREALNRRAQQTLTGYPDNWDAEYLARLRAVDAAAVRQTALKYWKPAEFVIIVVGDQRAYNSLVSELDSLSGLGAPKLIKKARFNEVLEYQ